MDLTVCQDWSGRDWAGTLTRGRLKEAEHVSNGVMCRKQRGRKAHVSLHSASMGLWHYQLELLAFLFLSWMQVQSAQGPLTSNALQSPQISHLNRTPCLPEVRHTHGEMKGFPGSPFPVRILGLRHQPASLIESPLSCALLQNCKN